MQPALNSYLPWHETSFRGLLAERAQLPHALLVHGHEGIGKLRFARAVAQALLCEARGTGCGDCEACRWFAAGIHPDFRSIEPVAAETDENVVATAKTRARIVIEQIRDLAGFINVSSHRGAAKVVLIHPAEALNLNAANALLKSLEEPPEGTYFLLVAHRIHFLLPTIRSRCRHIALPAPQPDAMVAWLAAQSLQNGVLALAHTGNAPLLALALGEGDFWQRRAVFLRHISTQRFDPLEAAEDIADYPLRDVIGWLQKWTFDLVLQKCLGKVRYNPDHAAATARLAAEADPVRLLRFHREVLGLQRVIDHPLNARLLLERLLIDYGEALKPHATVC